MTELKIKEILIEKDEKFKNLYLKHQEYERTINNLNKIYFKSDNEILKYKRIKRDKLRLKDLMQLYIDNFRQRLTN